MKICNRTLASLVRGSIYNLKKDNGYMMFYRCNQQQMDYLEKVDSFLYDRTFFQSSVTLEFETNATSFSLNYKVFNVGSFDSFDVYVNGTPYKFIQLERHIKQAVLEVLLPEGDKYVVVYLPCDSQVGIKDLVIDGEWKKHKVKRDLVLCYGDSITNGYGSLKSSITYINVLSRELGIDVVNQGIGGYWFDENYVCSIGNVKPDKILVSLGTNQLWSTDKYERINNFFKVLEEVYPKIPTLVITPIWRGDREGTDDLILDMKNYLINKCLEYPNIKCIDGFKLVPHIEHYFLDKLHPNSLGMEIYGRNLANEIKKINW